MSRLIYLACPYSDPDPAVRKRRFETVNRVAARLMSAGAFIFSPISHTHPIAEAGELPKGWEFWRDYDTEIIRCCAELFVLRLPGWENSVGVTAEMALAAQLGVPITFLDLE